MSSEVKEIVLSIISRRTGIKISNIFGNSRFIQDLHLDGDDAVDSLIEISKRTALNLDGFDVSIYFNSEPNFISFFKSKKSIVQEITVKQVTDSAISGIPLVDFV